VSAEGRRALVRAVLVVALGTAGFFLLERPLRELESAAAVALLRLFGADGVSSAGSATIAVFPSQHVPFAALVTAACSSLPALLAVAALGTLTTSGPPARRMGAISTALAVVLLGNVLRIAASVAAGLVAGRGSLVLFHDWVGSIFTFAYALGGYTLMLYLLLPRRADAPATEARVVAG
jgi:carbamoyl-phosphate synthase large subunit